MSTLHINFNTAENSTSLLQREHPELHDEMESVIADTKHLEYMHGSDLPDTYRIYSTDNKEKLVELTNRFIREDQLKFDRKWESWSIALVCVSDVTQMFVRC